MPPLLLSFSAFCFVVTMGMHIAARLGAQPSNETLTAFLMAAFPVVFAAFFLHPDYRRDGPSLLFPWGTVWRYAGWMKLALAALLAYALWFFVSKGVPHRWSIGTEPLSPLLAQASSLVLAWLYAFSTALIHDKQRSAAKIPF